MKNLRIEREEGDHSLLGNFLIANTILTATFSLFLLIGELSKELTVVCICAFVLLSNLFSYLGISRGELIIVEK